MNGLPSLHRITIWAEDKTAFLQSWETLIALRPGLIYPGGSKGQPDNTEWTIYIRNAMATLLMEGKKMTAFLRLRNI